MLCDRWVDGLIAVTCSVPVVREQTKKQINKFKPFIKTMCVNCVCGLRLSQYNHRRLSQYNVRTAFHHHNITTVADTAQYR